MADAFFKTPQTVFLKLMVSGLPWWVQWLRFHASKAGGKASITCRGAKIPVVLRVAKKKKIDDAFTIGELILLPQIKS